MLLNYASLTTAKQLVRRFTSVAVDKTWYLIIILFLPVFRLARLPSWPRLGFPFTAYSAFNSGLNPTYFDAEDYNPIYASMLGIYFSPDSLVFRPLYSHIHFAILDRETSALMHVIPTGPLPGLTGLVLACPLSTLQALITRKKGRIVGCRDTPRWIP